MIENKKKVNKKKSPGEVIQVRPTGIQVLIEHLTSQELVSGGIILMEKTDIGTPQAYVLAIGSGLEDQKDKLGFKVGDRVLVQGKYIPVPKPTGQIRELGIVSFNDIKAVLDEK